MDLNLLMLLPFVILPLSYGADTSCTLSGSSIDNLSTVKASCTDIKVEDLVVPAGQTLNLKDLLNGTTVTFQGNVTFGYKEWAGPLIRTSGYNIRIIGTSTHVLDGRGYLWWDGLGGNGGKSKPKFFRIRALYDSIIEGLYILNSPKHCFSVGDSKNVTFTRITIDDKYGDENGGHNTDGFGVVSGSEGIYFINNTIYNQDDCLAINGGTNIYFTDTFCSGGHGISVGSVNTNSPVENVYVSNCEIVDSDNGVRIKTIYNASSYVTGVRYENITLRNITEYGIVIRGDYLNSGPTGTPTDGVPITNFNLSNIQGTVQESGTNVYVLVKNASNWFWKNINVTGGKNYKTCVGIPEGTGYECGSERSSCCKVSVQVGVLIAVSATIGTHILV